MSVTVSQPQDKLIMVEVAAFIPAVQIAAAAGTRSVSLILSVAGRLPKSGEAAGSETHTMLIPYNDSTVPAQAFEFHVPTPAGSLTVTAARLIYNPAENHRLSKPKNPVFGPPGVIDSRYYNDRLERSLKSFMPAHPLFFQQILVKEEIGIFGSPNCCSAKCNR